MFLPLSTDHHDGRIGIVSLIIIGICLLVHLIVHPDTQRVEREIDALYETHMDEMMYGEESESFEEMTERLIEDSDTYGELAANISQLGQSDALDQAIDSVMQTSLTYRGGLVKKTMKFWNLFTHMFIHGDWWHLIGNLWFFYIVGIMMERYWGSLKFLALYLVIGVFAGLGFIVISELQGADVETVPLVGASGAIAGMMGALWACGRHIRVKLFYLWGFRGGITEISMGWYLGLYFVGQLIYGVLLGKYSAVAYMAHVAGFVLGVAFGYLVAGKKFEGYHTEPSVLLDETPDISALPQVAGEPVETVAESQSVQPGSTTNTITEGWKSFANGDYPRATQEIISGIDRFMGDVKRFEGDLVREFDTIYEKAKQLQIPADTYYHWAMNLDMANIKKPALISYELAAQYTTDNPDFRMKSILKSAEIRVDTGIDTPRALKFLQFIVQNDVHGRYRNEAEFYIQKLHAK